MRFHRVGSVQLGVTIAGKFEAGGGGPVADLTLMLAHFDGADNQPTTTDEVPTVLWDLDPAAGGASESHLDTAQSVFGGSALTCGTSTGIDATAASFVSPHAGSWTYEVFYRISAADFSGGMAVQLLTAAGENSAWFQPGAGAENDFAFIVWNQAGAIFIINTAVGVQNADEWYYASIVRDVVAGTYDQYHGLVSGGVATRQFQDAVATDARNMERFNWSANIGSDGRWIEESRFSRVARPGYSGASYAIPAAPFVLD